MTSTTATSKLRGIVAGAMATLLLVAAPAMAVQPFSADYQASYMGMSGNGRMTLTAAGANRWTYTLSVTSPLADLKQSTVFEAKGDDLRPLSGTDSSKVLTKRQTKNAVYDWGKGAASWSGDIKPERAGPIKLQAGDLDALLINLAIVRDVKAGKPLSYRMVEDGRGASERTTALVRGLVES